MTLVCLGSGENSDGKFGTANAIIFFCMLSTEHDRTRRCHATYEGQRGWTMRREDLSSRIESSRRVSRAVARGKGNEKNRCLSIIDRKCQIMDNFSGSSDGISSSARAGNLMKLKETRYLLKTALRKDVLVHAHVQHW